MLPVAKIQPGYPEDWSTLTPLQKREWRQKKFISGEGIKFVSPEAKKAYKVRAQRTIDAYNLKEPDRVPVSLPMGDAPYNLFGINAHTAMYQAEKAVQACQEFNAKYSAELEYWAAPMTMPARALEILDYKLYAWPGHGLAKDAPGYQFVEGEYMFAEEYDDLIRDPSDFWMRTYLPRVFGILDSFNLMSPLTDIIEIPSGQIGILANPKIRATLRKLLDAGDELEKRSAIIAPYMGGGLANGYPMSMGAYGIAPFDIIGDTLRGTTSIMKDMYRHPDKLMKAMDVIADIHIHSILHSHNVHNSISVFFPLHKGADGWMSQKQFDKFYFPTLKRVMDALINEGLICTLFAEGSYNTRLESANIFPKGSVSWLFDQTDMARAKQILGSNCSIQGNVPSSLMVTGSAKDVKAYCKNLIETCGPGGGYILAAGCVAENPKLENLRAMMESVKEYGVYKK
jgi:hypothetical protein